MNTSSTPDRSSLQKPLSRSQILSALAGVLVLLAATGAFLLSRSTQPQGKRAVAVEMSTVNRDIESDNPIAQVTQAPPGSHEEQVRAEILENMRYGAQNQR